MLCCWLQQLQEFGGPEVEKPDLLQLGSVNSLRPAYLQTSGGAIPRHTFFKDPRARYNVSISVICNNCTRKYILYRPTSLSRARACDRKAYLFFRDFSLALNLQAPVIIRKRNWKKEPRVPDQTSKVF